MMTFTDEPDASAQTPDADLIRRTLAGDRSAAERLTERHRRNVLTIAYRALGNADDAHDVAQEALVYALQHLAHVRDGDKLAVYLRRVTLTLCAEYRRRRGTRRLGEPITALSEWGEEQDHARIFVIREAVAHLSDDHRTTLLLHYVGGWSLAEVAAMMATPLNTVRSRLMAAKSLLRADLAALYPETVVSKGTRTAMPATLSPTPLPGVFSLTEAQTALLHIAFPAARIISTENHPEPWMPFGPRVRLSLPNGDEKTVDFRSDLDAHRIALLTELEPLGVPGPQVILAGQAGGHALCKTPRGENLSLWTLGGTPHRIRIATERAFEAIDRLQNATSGLLDGPSGASLARRTLGGELEILTTDAKWNEDAWLAEEGKSRAEWLRDPWFAGALLKVSAAVADIHAPLVYTHYTHFFPQNYRIAPQNDLVGDNDEPQGFWGGAPIEPNPLVEFVSPFGHLGDPLLGLAMVWAYDCYPFVHTGFVEEFLWRRDVSRREFAPRLGLKALQMIARDLPVNRPDGEGAAHWDRLRGWADQALGWM